MIASFEERIEVRGITQICRILPSAAARMPPLPTLSQVSSTKTGPRGTAQCR